MQQLPPGDSGVMSEKFFLLQYLYSDMSQQQQRYKRTAARRGETQGHSVSRFTLKTGFVF